MPAVIDASVAVKWFIDESGSEAARHLLDPPEGEPGIDQLIAPALILIELHYLLSRFRQRSVLTPRQCQAAVQQVPVLVLIGPLDPANALRATALAEQFANDPERACGAYDSAYVCYAAFKGASLITADRRQAALAASQGVAVRLIT